MIRLGRLLAVVSALVLALAVCVPSFAQTPLIGRASPQATNALLSGVSAPGDGAAVDLLQTADKFSATLTVSGTPPASIVVQLKGSIDGLNYVVLQTYTSTAWPDAFQVYFKPAR